MSNGIRINWMNTSYFTVESENADEYTFSVKWKYKASIMTEEIVLKKQNLHLQNYFKQFGIAALNKDTYVNLGRILTIQETQVHGPVDKTLVRIVFVDGFELIRKIESTQWVWWKSTYA